MGLLDRLRGKRDVPGTADVSRSPDDALYVHLANDGGILLVRGRTGEQLWVDRDVLQREIEALKQRRGLLLYSRDHGDRDPPPHVTETFQLIVDLEPPAIQLVDDPHPEAKVPPDRRRTLTRDR